MDNKKKLLIIILDVIFVLLGLFLLARGALGAFNLKFGARGLLIPVDIILGGAIPLIGVLVYELYNKYVF